MNVQLMMKNLTRGLAACALGISLSANAAFIEYMGTFGPATTNWGPTNINLPQFNPGLGTLNSVVVTLKGTLTGQSAAESLDGQPAVLNLNLQTQIDMTKPFGGGLLTVSPAANNVFNASAFDTIVDFGGTSGVTYSGLNSMLSTSFNDGANLASYIGVGNVAFAVQAAGLSQATGAGNLISQFQTNAEAKVTVRYDFNNTTILPEPGTVALLGLGLAGLGLANRRKRK